MVTVILMMLLTATPAFAGQWKLDNNGWWYQNDDSSYPVNSWQWIDGKCYYFNTSGYCLINTVTPDGYTVDETGAWIVNGVVQTQNVDSVKSEFEAGWIYGTYETHEYIDAVAEIGWYTDVEADYIRLEGATKDERGVSEFVGVMVSYGDNDFIAFDDEGSYVCFHYNGIDTIEITESSTIGGIFFHGFEGIYHKTKDLSHEVG